MQEKHETTLKNSCSFWLLGLCNNFGFILMLTAAHDIIKQFGDVRQPTYQKEPFSRECNHLSTGVVLLADVCPALLAKIVVPFISGFTYEKIACSIVLSMSSFVTVALAETESVALVGIVLTSVSFGLGESTLMGYTIHFNKSAVKAWSSGTGGAAIISSLSYSIMKQMEIKTKTIFLSFLAVPCIEIVIFWGLLSYTEDSVKKRESENDEPNSATKVSLLYEKIRFIPKLFKYILPLVLIYFSQYFINQGLLELIHFPHTSFSRADQYRWYQVTYQISVFISRSSVQLFRIRVIWLLALLQFLNMVYFSLEAVWRFTPHILIVFSTVFFEGLVGGSAFSNTFLKISEDVPHDKREFSLSITTLSDAPGIALSGVVAVPIHNFICSLPT